MTTKKRLTTFSLILLLLFCYHSNNIYSQISQKGKIIASQHPITINKPAVNFFQGALLGNGGMGVVVNTRPDAVEFHFGHNNVWDIRVAENNKDKIGNFQKIFEWAKSIPSEYKKIRDDKSFNDYMDLMCENYAKPYPRPMPCGTLILGFDRREVELLGHKLDISNGICEVYLNHKKRQLILQIFTEMISDRLWFRLIDDQGNPQPSCFKWIKLMPDPATPSSLPKFKVLNQNDHILSFRQTMPYLEADKWDSIHGHPKDNAFRLTVSISNKISNGERFNWYGNMIPFGNLERNIIIDTTSFFGFAQLNEGLSSTIKETLPELFLPNQNLYLKFKKESETSWANYWSKSSVQLSDMILEKVWYQNLYFLNCAVKPEAKCPGLFANWSYQNIGTAWHGDYHMNYNTQQPFWVTFSSNHVEKNLAYVNLVYQILPISQKWAKEYYGMKGAFFPHSAYPVDMTIMPFPVPDWGWEICETPWTVQGLWWHYLYTNDKEYLKNKAFYPIKEAVLFLVDYMTRPDAHGGKWNDDKYHVFPTCAPEMYSLKPGFKYNFDCNVDLTLIKFVFNAYLESTKILKLEKQDKEIIANVKNVLAHFPDYTIKKSSYGNVIVGVPNEPVEVVFNTPNTLASVFPGEEHGLHSSTEMYNIMVNTYKNHLNEGGNDLVFMNLQAARLAILDLEKFKRQINYCLLPNGTCTDMELQTHGRYTDDMAFDWMGICGIWFENFSLPVVINECLMQSYNGTIRLFPNWPLEKDAQFNTLRAVGGFLVSASLKNGKVEWIEIESEAGAMLNIILPWKSGATVIINNNKVKYEKTIFSSITEKGQKIKILPLE